MQDSAGRFGWMSGTANVSEQYFHIIRLLLLTGRNVLHLKAAIPILTYTMTIRQFFLKHKSILLYGTSLAMLLFLLRWLELRFVIFDHALEIYVGAIAVIFTALGIWLALKLTRPKIERVVVEKEIYIEKGPGFIFNEAEMIRLGISKRELEVLQLMAEGLSNAEIAARLFVSLNTIKTHASNLFFKLNASRRTQAIEKAKSLCLIP
jgi:DNA-binding CsgD family transcriptional regulator